MCDRSQGLGYALNKASRCALEHKLSLQHRPTRAPTAMTESTPSVPVVPTAHDSVSRETFEQLKADHQRMLQEYSVLKAKEQLESQQKQERLSSLASQTKEFFTLIRDESDDAPTNQHIDKCVGWHDTWAGDNTTKLTGEALEQHTDLSIALCAASAKLKRARDVDGSAKENAELLKQIHQEKDRLKEECSKMERRATEAEEMARERQEQNEQLTLQLQKEIMKNNATNFRHPAMREMRRVETTPAAASMSTPPASKTPSSVATTLDAAPQVTAETMVSVEAAASKGKAPAMDPAYQHMQEVNQLVDLCKQSGPPVSKFFRAPHSSNTIWGADPSDAQSNAMLELAAAIRA